MNTAAMKTQHSYYVPHPSPYPSLLSLTLLLMGMGVGLWINSVGAGPWFVLAGVVPLLYVLFRWFGAIIAESEGGIYRHWEDRSFRLGMIWFIASEIVLFATFFGVLFYERNISVPWLASFGSRFSPWPGFTATWPTSGPGGRPFSTVQPWGIPAINTLLLLSSGATVTWAHWGLQRNRRLQLIVGLFLTVLLGVVFLALQAMDFHHAYTELGLTLGSGVYGATFFMLTGLHGFHVTLGVIMLTVILMRSIKGHFNSDRHFAFEAVSWYWHFVDVVWLCLFVFVYWL
jgi:cytochrome c oxidase subunit 3